MAITLLSFVILSSISYQVLATEVTSMQCGTTNFTREYISNGNKTERGEWPFLTALFRIKEEENDFFCGGTLISAKHVLTAAHCIQGKDTGNKLFPGHISVILGAYDLTSKTEVGVQKRDVQEIHVHPEWNIYSDKYDADLAILLLSEVVLFTDYIRPVCIPTDDTVLDNVRGTVVGWGRTEVGWLNIEFIMRATVTVQNGYYCLVDDPNAATISSKRTFCGRGDDGNPSKGDSGGGFYVKNQESFWELRGIVSSVRSNSSGFADADLVVVYTNVAKFKNWITDTSKQSGIRSDVKVNLECEFGYSRINNMYTCFTDNLDIQSDNIAVASFSGSHLRRKTDRNIEQISFNDGTMFYIHSGVGQIFKKVKKIEIRKM